MNPFEKYHSRFVVFTSTLNWKDPVAFSEAVASRPGEVNNLFMSGLGMATLFLRMGAVIQMSERLHDGDSTNDALFLKQVMDNLRETLPSDTNWKNLWLASMQPGSRWEKALTVYPDKNTVLDRFVTFRNRFVHQFIRVVPEQTRELAAGLDILETMAGLYVQFEGGELMEQDGKFHWHQHGVALELHPFVQKGEYEGLPYLFQGLYDNKTRARFINTVFGDETDSPGNRAIDEQFAPMMQALRGGAGQVFDHSTRMQYYRECFVGRDRELKAVLDWVQSDTNKNSLPIYSSAGMGKGALTAAIADALMAERIPVMFHFCGSGLHNNLHAMLYHFIMQGKKMPGMNGAGVWKVTDEAVQRKMERLPSRYFDALKLFQMLLTECYAPPAKYADKPLVIIIDGLDDAAVANSQLRIADWFYTYNDKDEPEEDWVSPPQVKWIFTYRWLGEQTRGGFQLGGRFALAEIPLLQPLEGLSGEAVREALAPFGVTEEFVQAVLEKGAVQ